MSWQNRKFKELISDEGVFTDGDWVESKDQDPDGEVRLIQLADVGLGKFIDKSARYLTKEKALELNCTFLKPGDILIARMPDPIGRACIFPDIGQECVTVVDVCVVRPNSEQVDNKWLMHMINSRLFNNQILNFVTGTTRQRISRGNLAKLSVKLPPLDEQKRIAAILDKADAIRQKRKQAIALADEFLRSVFLEMFGDPVTNPKGWEVKPLSELIMKGDKINYGIVQPGDHVEDGIAIVRVGDIKDGSIDKSKLKRVARSIDEKHSKSRLIGDEILITCVGATVGKVALADESLSGFNTVRALTRIRLNEEVNRSFVFRYLQSPFIQGYFQSQLRTVGQPTLNGKQIGETPILLPNLNMQREFLQLSDMAQTAKDLSNSQLIEADNMFNALSQKAFSGQL
ncbi:restriction endonuclease subunit S [Vibrio vulnificus]|uniref:restriction endonuclease subunit S n=1 Tax=Vibrio vulnificus TaxID=672 RepID=UPI0009B707D6|nr:restriction endonuclease subunit S [Vibrio vulnificus]OQK46111.1 hypothetical protein XM74_c11301 [Vibrio vulnificus]POC18797.1 restriction endonuclease subunit S [Vibrio vulnificus]